MLSKLDIPADDLSTLIKMSRWADNVSFYRDGDKVRFQYHNRPITALVVITVEGARLVGDDFTLDNQTFNALKNLPLDCASHNVVITVHNDMSVIAKLGCGNMQCETSGIRASERNILRLKGPPEPVSIFNLYMKAFAKTIEESSGDIIGIQIDGRKFYVVLETSKSRTSITANGVGPDSKFSVNFNPEYLLDEMFKMWDGVTGGTIKVAPCWIIQFDMFINEMPMSIHIAPIQEVVNNGVE